MIKNLLSLTVITAFMLVSVGCASRDFRRNPNPSYFAKTRQAAELQQAQIRFNEGYYKRAKLLLLPLACNGNPQAQYALGYMYYYGYGVAQDTVVGHFWITRAADNGCLDAIQALCIIEKNCEKNLKERRHLTIFKHCDKKSCPPLGRPPLPFPCTTPPS